MDTAADRPADDEHGVAFPVLEGRRSTTATGRAAFADAARAVDTALAEQIEAEPDWRKGYPPHVRRVQEAGLRGASQSLAVAQAGLDTLHARFELIRDGQAASLGSALTGVDAPGLDTVVVRGETTGGPDELSVPYRGEQLRGDSLHRQLDRWVQAGTVEPSFAEAIRRVVANPDWLDLSDRQVVVLGAGAEMGPLSWLCRWGAHVLPVDLPDPAVWTPVLEAVRRGRGHASVPVRGPVPAGHELAQAAGADLVHDLPEVATWLDGVEGALTVGNYVYADGAAHVRVAMAADALTAYLAGRRDDCSLAFLVTPTDVFAVPEQVVDMAQRRYADRPVTGALEAAARAVTRRRLFAPNYDALVTTAEGRRFGIADSLVPQQGPNYALAKSLQRWRAVIARRDGLRVSANVAPPSGTRSVVKNRLLAAAYAGAHRFGVEVFDPPTANTLMAALLVHDLRHTASAANPATRLDHPQQLFAENANHGGLWRNPFAPRSVLGLAVLFGIVPPRRR